jgi:C4-dicarboxylate-specific signal transduction histidine kinase
MDERRRAEDLVQQHLAELAHVARLSTVGEMVAELAHELNQPLSAICSYAQACKRLLHCSDPNRIEEMSDSMNQVSEQADRAAEIIRRLRRFVAKSKPLQVVVHVNDMIRDVVELMKIDARMARAEVALELTEPLPPVVGDRIQLEQVLVNLLCNAYDSLRESDRETRRATIRTKVDGRRNVLVDVEDNGAGIPSDIADRVFDRFFTTKPDGMGMGLAISQSILEHHGGKLWITSNSEPGVSCHFTLPIDSGEHIRGN